MYSPIGLIPANLQKDALLINKGMGCFLVLFWIMSGVRALQLNAGRPLLVINFVEMTETVSKEHIILIFFILYHWEFLFPPFLDFGRLKDALER